MRFAINVDFIVKVKLDVVPFDVSRVVFRSSYIYIWDAIFMQRSKQYHLIKDGKSFIINAHKRKSKILIVRDNQAKKLISSIETYVLLSLREKKYIEGSMRENSSLEVHTKNKK